MNKKLTKLLSVFVIAGAISTGAVVGVAGCSKPDKHEHTAATEWQSDATNHWHECTANDGAKLDEGAHVYDDDQDTTCNTCGYVRTVTPADVAVTGVTLDKTTASLKMGETESVTLTATVSPANATNKAVTWSSDNTAVATVANGVVTAVAAGTAKITVTTANGKTATCTVTVEAADPVIVEVTGVTLDKTEATLKMGETESVTLTATVAPEDASDKTVTWSSSNEEVATVANGVVTAVAAGTATITVTTANDMTATCVVTVEAAEEPVDPVDPSTPAELVITGKTYVFHDLDVTAPFEIPADLKQQLIDSLKVDLEGVEVTFNANGTVTSTDGSDAIWRQVGATVTVGVAPEAADYIINGNYLVCEYTDPETSITVTETLILKGASENPEEPTEPTVTSVTVTAAEGATTVANGGTLQLSAAVVGENEPAQTVTWSIAEGATATEATISADGLLSAGTVAGTVTVIATSTVDASQSGSLTITVEAAEEPEHTHTADSEWHTDENEHWHVCTEDGELMDKAAHVYDNDDDTTCNICGYVRVITYTITYEGIDGISGTNGNPTSYNTESATITLAPVEKADSYFAGWYNAAGEKVTSIAAGTTGNITLTAKWMTITEISTVDEFLAFRSNATPSGAYVLTADIDLAGVALEAPAAVISADAIFDGQGHVIKNASYANAGSKEGLLLKTITGGTVTNVKFLGCSIVGTSESAAIVAGECNGNATLSKIEFNSCSVTCAGGGYGGLLFARREGSEAITINISEITAKNGCKVTTPKYGGLLVGDSTGATTINLTNIDIDGELVTGDGNGAFLLGRSRGGAVSVENAVISCKISAASPYIIVGGSGKPSSYTIKNVLVVSSNAANLVKTAPDAPDVSGLYAVSGVTVTGATEGENTVAFLTDTLGLDFTNVWTTEGENNANYRLAAASTNVKSADAVITEVKVITSNAKTRFKKGEAFTADGINVMGVYSDGVQLVLNAGEGYSVDATAFIPDTAGEYIIWVKSIEDDTVMATYNVTVVEEVGFEIIDAHMDHVYLVGDSLDTANLVVKSIWSDGVKEKLAASAFTIDANSYDMATAGKYEVSITHGEYAAQTVAISVLNSVPQVVDGKVYVNVSAAHDGINGALVNGVETFTSVKDAINFYETIGYEADVTKVIYVGEGTYTDKITTALDNLVLIGEGTDKSVMTYSAVESTVDPVTGAQYGLTCATLQVNGTGFRAYNIAIRNDFDYINDAASESSPQGLALTINGDQAVLQNVLLYGNQDTLYLKSGRTYIKDSEIDGNIDFIFGEANGLAYFDTCTIKAINKSTKQESNNGYVTAMKADESNKPNYGYIFANCTFTDDGTLATGSMSLGRPWGAKATVAYISCEFSAAYSTAAYDGKTKSRWFDMSGNLPANADFCEYNSTGEGAITEAVAGGRILTEEEAANYTKTNIFAATNGLCTWSAAWDCDAAVTALAELTGATVAATELYASATEISVEEGATAELWLGVAPWNANDKEVTVTVADESIATWSMGVLTGVTAGTTTITVSKAGLTDKVVTVTVTASTAPASTTYTYTYGAENGSEWATTATTTNSSLDATPVTGLKVLDTDSFSLTASGKKATITLNGFTTGTSKAAAYVTVTFKDAGGNSLGTLTGTTTADKVVGDFTFTSDGVFTSETAFATVEISCNTAGKHFSIVTLSIVVE